MQIYLEQPWTSHEVWEMSALVVASAPLPFTLVLKRAFPMQPANARIDAIAARVN